jgi:beta-lactamase regulating signal transducer with metallopeptidase domain
MHSLWQGAVAACVFALLRFALRRAAAQVRYLAGCGSLVLLAAAPLVTFVSRPATLFPFFSTSSASYTAGAITNQGGTPIEAFAPALPAFLPQLARVLADSLPWVVAAWLMGSAVFLARWLQGCWWIRRAKRLQTEPVREEWLERLNDLKCRLNLFRPVGLLKSALVDVPMVVGWLRPVILLPASSLTGLSPEQLETILAHELAHVRRYDYLVNAFQTLVETFIFYHPAVWWISRCIREEREHCCDDLVARLYEDRMPYARALMMLETLRSGPVYAAVERTAVRCSGASEGCSGAGPRSSRRAPANSARWRWSVWAPCLRCSASA